eukprot:GHVU01023183.1.p1 GENE.GHVU01023183.1~~GHVU01023183.1.p1  ORF type:complete len:348 (+),score=49.22 GHVU01023183.1:105-1046(+)
MAATGGHDYDDDSYRSTLIESPVPVPLRFDEKDGAHRLFVSACAALTTKCRLAERGLRLDGDDSDQLAFVEAASTLRARSFGVPPADSRTVKLIGFRLVPALASSTTVASALAALDVVSVLLLEPPRQGAQRSWWRRLFLFRRQRRIRKLRRNTNETEVRPLFKNRFFNIAASAFTSAAPPPPPTAVTLLAGGRLFPHSVWDPIRTRPRRLLPSNATLADLLQDLAKALGGPKGVTVSSVSLFGRLVYLRPPGGSGRSSNTDPLTNNRDDTSLNQVLRRIGGKERIPQLEEPTDHSLDWLASRGFVFPSPREC